MAQNVKLTVIGVISGVHIRGKNAFMLYARRSAPRKPDNFKGVGVKLLNFTHNVR